MNNVSFVVRGLDPGVRGVQTPKPLRRGFRDRFGGGRTARVAGSSPAMAIGRSNGDGAERHDP